MFFQIVRNLQKNFQYIHEKVFVEVRLSGRMQFKTMLFEDQL